MRRLIALAPLALLLAACGGGGGGGKSAGSSAPASTGSSMSLQTIQVSEKEFSITPATINVTKPGEYTFAVKNEGTLDHAFEVEGHGVEQKTNNISPGSSATLQVDLAKAGSYEVYCPIDDHKGKGMKATLTVGGTAAPGVGGTQTGTTTTSPTTTQSQPGY